MLVLSRKLRESILVGPDIEIRVNKIEGDVVKIGIVAPREVSIYRKEVLEDIQATNQEAVLSESTASDQLKKVRHLLPSSTNPPFKKR